MCSLPGVPDGDLLFINISNALQRSLKSGASRTIAEKRLIRNSEICVSGGDAV